MISRLNVLHSSMTKPKAKKRHAMLTEVIRRHDHAYYVLAEPTINDSDYDRLYRELLDLEEAHPGLLTADSPSQRVGGKPVSEFPEHRHAVPMMSLDNTYSQEEVREFVAGYEVERCPLWLWEEAILQGYAAFRFLREKRRARLSIDFKHRRLRVREISQ